jgi:hypothetical protein
MSFMGIAVSSCRLASALRLPRCAAWLVEGEAHKYQHVAHHFQRFLYTFEASIIVDPH